MHYADNDDYVVERRDEIWPPEAIPSRDPVWRAAGGASGAG